MRWSSCFTRYRQNSVVWTRYQPGLWSRRQIILHHCYVLCVMRHSSRQSCLLVRNKLWFTLDWKGFTGSGQPSLYCHISNLRCISKLVERDDSFSFVMHTEWFPVNQPICIPSPTFDRNGCVYSTQWLGLCNRWGSRDCTSTTWFKRGFCRSWVVDWSAEEAIRCWCPRTELVQIVSQWTDTVVHVRRWWICGVCCKQ